MQIRQRIFLSLFVIVSSIAIFACETPDKTLSEYLRRDFKGERLSHEVSSGIDNMEVDAKFEPAWDVTILTTGFEIRSLTHNADKAVATVLFKNAWETTGSKKPDPTTVKDEIVEIHLVRIKTIWKVSPPFYPPHVHPDVMLGHIEKLIRDAKKAEAEKNYLDNLESELNNVREYRNAFILR